MLANDSSGSSMSSDELEATIRKIAPKERPLFRANVVDPSQKEESLTNDDMVRLSDIYFVKVLLNNHH